MLDIRCLNTFFSSCLVAILVKISEKLIIIIYIK
ncbi:MAG: hypothetical protein MRERC_1c070 [Mycoplasmataceae bacterium RC_NB112A]|nr:MAG: hypothetical protein MRERC_1c070 [Mycoplasmataceae bacterium RC_NB112A]